MQELLLLGGSRGIGFLLNGVSPGGSSHRLTESVESGNMTFLVAELRGGHGRRHGERRVGDGDNVALAGGQYLQEHTTLDNILLKISQLESSCSQEV